MVSQLNSEKQEDTSTESGTFISTYGIMETQNLIIIIIIKSNYTKLYYATAIAILVYDLEIRQLKPATT